MICLSPNKNILFSSFELRRELANEIGVPDLPVWRVWRVGEEYFPIRCVMFWFFCPSLRMTNDSEHSRTHKRGTLAVLDAVNDLFVP
jgi:hypothetical protein